MKSEVILYEKGEESPLSGKDSVSNLVEKGNPR